MREASFFVCGPGNGASGGFLPKAVLGSEGEHAEANEEVAEYYSDGEDEEDEKPVESRATAEIGGC